MAKSKKKKTETTTPRASKSEETFTISKTALWQIVSGVLAVVLIVLLAISLTGNNAPVAPTQPGQPTQPTQPTPQGPIEVNLEGVRSIGDENAPVVIVEYSDFTCPFCQRFYQDTYSLIKQNFIDQGLVRFIYKDFPVVGGQRAAEAGWCAHEQDRFFDYKTRIFQNPRETSDANLVQWAEDLGLDRAQFQDCLTSGRYQSNVAAERQEAINNGIRGTPGFILNGQVISGAQPYQVFEQAINQALN